jgi:predicted ribosome quality control (RQC) complex YloA/Tae2 family protein
VNGAIQAKEVVVNTGWPDYVFNSDYKLRPLQEVASYIQEHHHLPDIPSQSDVDQKGVSLGDMQSKLLAKIEELTIHMIKEHERNDRLEQQNLVLQKEIEDLRERITR